MPEEKNMPTAAAYIRVSTDDQAELSPDSQLEEIKKYASRGRRKTGRRRSPARRL